MSEAIGNEPDVQMTLDDSRRIDLAAMLLMTVPPTDRALTSSGWNTGHGRLPDRPAGRWRRSKDADPLYLGDPF